MAKINCTVNIQVTGQVSGGAKITFAHVTEVEAYGWIEVVIPKGGAETEVAVQPGGAASFLLITADRYDDKLSYAVSTGETDAALIYKVDGPHLLLGEGSVSLLDQAPASLFFTNTDATADVKVQIHVGRDATP